MPPQMRSHRTALIVSLVVVSLLLIGALVFGFWAYGGRQDYKNNVDQKISAAVSTAKQTQMSTDQQQFAEASKSPLKTFLGPVAYGNVALKYPKTWSAYVVSNSSDPIIDAYFAPDVINDIQNSSSVFSLRMQISTNTYSSELANYQSAVQGSTATVTPYTLPNVPSVVGSEITGQLDDGNSGTMILIPLRANTLKVWVESNQYLNDFNTYILPNLTFSP
jgi:hypothetical protein